MDSWIVAAALLGLAGLPAAAGTAPVDLKQGLVVHYPFDKDAADASGKGHHGKVQGATAVAEGKIGGALSFDGKDDFVAVPAAATQGLLRFTLALWVKTEQAGASPRATFWQNPTLVGVASGGWGSRDLSLMLENGRAAYFHGLPGAEVDMACFSATAVNDGQWHHLALVNDGPRVRLFVDRRLARGDGFAHGGGSATHLGKLTQTASGAAFGAAPLFIGATDDAHGSPTAKCHFQGLIDDVRLWRRALSPAEIAALPGQPTTPASPPDRR